MKLKRYLIKLTNGEKREVAVHDIKYNNGWLCDFESGKFKPLFELYKVAGIKPIK